MALELSFVDGSFVVGAIGFLVALGKFLYDLRKDINRIKRDVYGADDDDTRAGLAVEQQRGFMEMMDRLDQLETTVETEFSEAERERRETREEVEELRESFDAMTTILTRHSSLEKVDLLDERYSSNRQRADEKE